MSELANIYADMPLACHTLNGQARDAALQAAAAVDVEATSIVGYRSAGYLLIVGDEAPALAAARRLGPMLHRTVLVTNSSANENDSQHPRTNVDGDSRLTVLRGVLADLTGHLGQYVATLQTPQGAPLNIAEFSGTGRPSFDLVLDLQPQPALDAELPPFGYYPVGGDAAKLDRALVEIPEMTGEFEKPKFFNYSPDICAHGDSGLTGCTRCLDACPTNAIKSRGDQIEVDPYLCQGGGSCATACPTGAIIYAYPGPKDQIARIRAMLKAYRAVGGERPVLLFHDIEAGADLVREAAPRLPEYVIPVSVAELGAAGMDTWLSSLAYGASQVVLLDTPAVPRSVRHELEAQLSYVHALLDAMGYERDRVTLVAADSSELADRLNEQPSYVPVAAAGFDTFNEKRGTLRLAIDHLFDQAVAPQPIAAMPAGAPFGQIAVDREKCTLCMSCSQVCPAQAIKDGGDKPQLNFVEDLCVQCGLCQTACPEDAITLDGRFLFDWEQRRRPRVLNEEEPLCCVSCGKPFATASVVRKMTERLRNHAMFKTEAELRRLQMCADCRVVDMFSGDLQDLPRPTVYGAER